MTYLRARDYSPGTGRFTSRDPVLPNAEGTQGWNPYWYANNSPATLRDPLGTQAMALPAPVACGVCTPLTLGAVAAIEAMVAWLAVQWKRARDYVTANATAIATFLVTAAILVCIASPGCHQDISTVVGDVIPETEVLKRPLQVGSTAQLHEAIRRHLQEQREPQPEPKKKPWDWRLPLPLDDDDDPPCQIEQPFRLGNFRRNLACLTNNNYPDGPPGYDAHHVFPRGPVWFKPRFDQILGMDEVHNPIYGQWWAPVDHQGRNSYFYGQRWLEFLGPDPTINPTREDTLAFGRLVMAEFGLTTLY